MLFLLPAGAVPLAVAAGLALSHLAPVPRREEVARVPLDLVNSWFTVGPAAVLLLAGEPGPALAHWPVFAGALAAQFALDFTSAAARETIALGFSPRDHVRYMSWVWLVDASLAPIGLLLAAGAVDYPYAFVLGMPLVGLLAVLARERGPHRPGARAVARLPRHSPLLATSSRPTTPTQAATAGTGRPRLDCPIGSGWTRAGADSRSSRRSSTTSGRSGFRARSSTSRARSTTTSGPS